MDASLMALARAHPFIAAIVCAIVVTGLIALAVWQGNREAIDRREGDAEAWAYFEEHGELMPGHMIIYTLEDTEEMLKHGTLRGKPLRFNIRKVMKLRDALKKRRDARK